MEFVRTRSGTMRNGPMNTSRDNGVSGQYFMKDDLLRYAAGVVTLQNKLRTVGYDAIVTAADGKFGNDTDTAVRYFQTQCDLTPDGKAGKSTLKMLDFVVNLPISDRAYFKLGRGRKDNEWGTTYIAGSSALSNVEAMARVIYTEDTGNLDGQTALALVIYNRTLNLSLFGRAGYTGSKWKSVVSKDGAFTTTDVGSDAQHPKCASYNSSTGTGSLHTPWTHCVDLANQLDLERASQIVRPTGLAVINDSSTSSHTSGTRTFTNQCYSTPKSVYESWIAPPKNARDGIAFANYVFNRD